MNKRKLSESSDRGSKVGSSEVRKITSYFTPIPVGKKNAEVSLDQTWVQSTNPDPNLKPRTVSQEMPSTGGNENPSQSTTSDNAQCEGSEHTTDMNDVEDMNLESTCRKLYKGFVLTLEAIKKKAGLNVLTSYYQKSGRRNRLYVKCQVCSENENEAKRFTSNGFVYIAHGIRCDSEKHLMELINHLLSPAHEAAMKSREYKKLWEMQSTSHPWLKLLGKQHTETVERLMRLAVDVYNDSKLLTPTAWSWPSRSLATIHADKQICLMRQEGFEANFVPYKPTPEELHYRDPVVYKEMLSVIGGLELKRLCQDMEKATVFSVQLDGSVDTMQNDNKYIFIRLTFPEMPLEVETRFLGTFTTDKRGSEGLFHVVIKGFEKAGITETMLKQKFAGITTDGESANTGRKSGLWKRLEDHLGRRIATFWCACHRSDLAMEDLESCVPELKTWKVNLLSVAEYYHTSAVRTKCLENIFPNMKRFPTYHSVRFGEHLVNLCNAVLHNLDATIQQWMQIVGDTNYDRKEKQTSKGFLKTWAKDGQQVYLTNLMSDVCAVFQQLEKQLQKPHIIITDVLRYRDVAMSKLNGMLEKPYPGGHEEQWRKRNVPPEQRTTESESSPTQENIRAARTRHSLVSGFTQNRNFSAVRNEVIQASINFLSQRLDEEQEELIQSIVKICGATSAAQFIDTSRPLLEIAGINDGMVKDFADSVYENFDAMRPNANIPERDYSVRVYHMLRASSGLVQKLLSAVIVVAPHSMTVERCVSSHNMLFTKLRTSTNNETVNERLLIAWNGKPTAEFDAREAVACFMQKKERRSSAPSPDIYKNREFVKKFFNV